METQFFFPYPANTTIFLRQPREFKIGDNVMPWNLPGQYKVIDVSYIIYSDDKLNELPTAIRQVVRTERIFP